MVCFYVEIIVEYKNGIIYYYFIIGNFCRNKYADVPRIITSTYASEECSSQGIRRYVNLDGWKNIIRR